MKIHWVFIGLLVLLTGCGKQIPSEIIAIDDNAFRDNAEIVNVNANYDLKYIGEFAFANSSIESVKLNFELLKSKSLINNHTPTGSIYFCSTCVKFYRKTF